MNAKIIAFKKSTKEVSAMDTNKVITILANFHFEGNIIDHSWLKTIQKNGKPYFEAIYLLSEIVYWYRPVILKDEQGNVILQKKFKSDILQMTYKQIEERTGIPKKTAQRALQFLEKLGVIFREYRTVEVQNTTLTNVMFIGLNIEKLLEISKKTQVIENKEKIESLSIPMDKSVHTYGQICPYPMDKSVHTYTKINNTKINNRDYINREYIYIKGRKNFKICGQTENVDLNQEEAASLLKNNNSEHELAAKNSAAEKTSGGEKNSRAEALNDKAQKREKIQSKGVIPDLTEIENEELDVYLTPNQVAQLFAKYLDGLVKVINPADMTNKELALLRKMAKKLTYKQWKEYIDKIKQSENLFKIEGWTPNFTWFMKEDNYKKVMRGDYIPVSRKTIPKFNEAATKTILAAKQWLEEEGEDTSFLDKWLED